MIKWQGSRVSSLNMFQIVWMSAAMSAAIIPGLDSWWCLVAGHRNNDWVDDYAVTAGTYPAAEGCVRRERF